MGEPLRIVIADDNYLVREGTRRLLEDSGQVTVLAAVGSAPELLDAVKRVRPDAVLTDIRMPPPGLTTGGAAGPAMEGIDAAHAIKAADPGVGVVILSQYADESYAFELFRNGTAGLAYLLKDRVGWTCCGRWPRAAGTQASPRSCRCRNHRWRNTSTRSSPSSTWPASSRCTGGWPRC